MGGSCYQNKDKEEKKIIETWGREIESRSMKRVCGGEGQILE